MIRLNRKITVVSSLLILSKIRDFRSPGSTKVADLLGFAHKIGRFVYQFPVLQSLPVHLLDRLRYALAIIHLAGVPAELKFVQIVRKVLPADAMERSHQASSA